MPGTADFVYLLCFTIIWFLLDQFILWPLFLRHVKLRPVQAKWWFWIITMVEQWFLVAVGIALWQLHDRYWSAIGLTIPEGWRLGISIGLVAGLVLVMIQSILAIRRQPVEQEKVRKQLGELTFMLPDTTPQLIGFIALSITAGFCEEFLFRGYFIWILSPWLGWWGAAALSIVAFGLLHSYQGFTGIIRTGIVGLALTLVVALLGSLIPAIILHALIDMNSGTIAWLALRKPLPTDDPS